VRLLLDTNILLKGALGELPEKIISLLEDEKNDLHYSAAAIWEIAIKTGMGKLTLNMSTRSFEAELKGSGYRPLNITPEHTHTTTTLKDIHKDPFDRIMVAQAVCEGMTLVTSDRLLAGYGDIVLAY
jgi:PIN domain nuclease of toxin-antitoxin system